MMRPWVVPVVFVLAGTGLFIAYLAQARTMPVHLDMASASGPQTLQAWAMLHGNLLLRGWQIGDVPYYTTELPEYVLVEALRGLNGDVVHVAAALTYTLMVLLAALLGRGTATGREGLIRMLIAAGIMLAPAFVTGTSVLLSGPDHTGTQVALLVIWLVLDRSRQRWWVPVLITVLLAWAMIADPLVLIEGVVPLVAVYVIRMFRRGPEAIDWYDLSFVAGPLASVVVAKAVLDLIKNAGGFTGRSPTLAFSSAAALSAHFWPKIGRVLGIYSANFLGLQVGQYEISPLLHLVGVALVAWAVAMGVRRFTTCDLTEQVLTTAFLVLLAAYIFGAKANPNEMVGLLPIGAVLAGRLVAGRVIRARLVPVLAVALICNAGLLFRYASKPPASNESTPTAAWFKAHHLTHGLASFEQAYSITVLSGGRVQVAPARIFGDKLVTADWENNASWFDPRRHYANFMIVKNFIRCGTRCPAEADLSNMFGHPIANYPVGKYRVLVWRQNLLASVPVLSWCYPGIWEWKALGPPSPGPCP
jgi:hypothetical protein